MKSEVERLQILIDTVPLPIEVRVTSIVHGSAQEPVVIGGTIGGVRVEVTVEAADYERLAFAAGAISAFTPKP